MAYHKPPQGWTMDTGTWGTDADRNDTVIQSGSYSFQFLATAVATKIRSSFIAAEQNLVNGVAVLVSTDDITAGYNITIEVEEYAADRTTLVNTVTLHSAVLAAANTWQWVDTIISPSTPLVRWYRVVFSKTVNTHNVYFDNVLVERFQPQWQLSRATTQSIPTAAWTTVVHNSTLSPAIQRAASSLGVVTAALVGSYNMTATAGFEAFSDGTEVDIRFKVVDSITTRYIYGQKVTAGGAHTLRVTLAATSLLLRSGDTVEVEVWHNEGSAVNISSPVATHYTTVFSGIRIGKI